jgi:hypothetical protein
MIEANDYPDPEDKQQRIAEVSATRRLPASSLLPVVAILARGLLRGLVVSDLAADDLAVEREGLEHDVEALPETCDVAAQKRVLASDPAADLLGSIRRRGTRWTHCPILSGTFS